MQRERAMRKSCIIYLILFVVAFVVLGCSLNKPTFSERLKSDFRILVEELDANQVSFSLVNINEDNPITREHFSFVYEKDTLIYFNYGKNEKSYVVENGVEDIHFANTKGMDLICWMKFKDNEEVENNCNTIDNNKLKLMRDFMVHNFLDSNMHYEEVCAYIREHLDEFEYIDIYKKQANEIKKSELLKI